MLYIIFVHHQNINISNDEFVTSDVRSNLQLAIVSLEKWLIISSTTTHIWGKNVSEYFKQTYWQLIQFLHEISIHRSEVWDGVIIRPGLEMWKQNCDVVGNVKNVFFSRQTDMTASGWTTGVAALVVGAHKTEQPIIQARCGKSDTEKQFEDDFRQWAPIGQFKSRDVFISCICNDFTSCT